MDSSLFLGWVMKSIEKDNLQEKLGHGKIFMGVISSMKIFSWARRGGGHAIGEQSLSPHSSHESKSHCTIQQRISKLFWRIYMHMHKIYVGPQRCVACIWYFKKFFCHYFFVFFLRRLVCNFIKFLNLFYICMHRLLWNQCTERFLGKVASFNVLVFWQPWKHVLIVKKRLAITACCPGII